MAEPSFEDLLSSPWLQFDLDCELLPHLVDFGPPPVRGFVTELQERRPWIFDLRDEGAQTTEVSEPFLRELEEAAASVCGHRYERPGGAEPGDRIVSCDLPVRHEGDHPSTEAVGEEVRRRSEWERELAAARQRSDAELREFWSKRLQADGWLDPAAAEKLRSDLSAMTSDRDWLREEFEKATAKIARLEHAQIWRGDRCRTCGGKEPNHQMWCRLFVGPVVHEWVKQFWNDFHKEWRHLCSCGAEKSDESATDPGRCPRADEVWRGAQPTAATKED